MGRIRFRPIPKFSKPFRHANSRLRPGQKVKPSAREWFAMRTGRAGKVY